MNDNKMKNIIVLKNLPSNLVEEAIVVLKHNKTKLPEHIEKSKEHVDIKINEKDYILKEAEMVVNTYISKMENANKSRFKKPDKVMQRKYNRLKWTTFGIIIAWIATIIF